MLAKHPLKTKAVTASLIMSLSDTLSQRLEQLPLVHSDHCDDRFQQDWLRTMHVGITGLTLIGPLSHAWYAWLEIVVTTHQTYLGIFLKMVLDAMMYSPVAVALYFTWRSVLEGREWHGVIHKLQQKWFSALQASWSFWPIANIVWVLIKVARNSMSCLLLKP